MGFYKGVGMASPGVAEASRGVALASHRCREASHRRRGTIAAVLPGFAEASPNSRQMSRTVAVVSTPSPNVKSL